MLVFAVVAWCALAGGLALLLARRAAARRAAAAGAASAGDWPRTVYETAFLAGGPGRVADTVVCAMVAKDRVLVEDSQLHVITATGDDELERELLAHCEEWRSPLRTLRTDLAHSAPVQRIGDLLAARGLLWPPELHRPWRRAARRQLALASAVLIAALLALAAGEAGAAVPLAAGALTALVTGVFLSPRRALLTGAGRATLDRVRRADPFAGLGLTALVALGGTAVLTDEALRMQLTHAAAGPAASTSASSSGAWAMSCGASGGGSGGDGGGAGGGASCGGGGGCGGGG